MALTRSGYGHSICQMINDVRVLPLISRFFIPLHLTKIYQCSVSKLPKVGGYRMQKATDTIFL